MNAKMRYTKEDFSFGKQVSSEKDQDEPIDAVRLLGNVVSQDVRRVKWDAEALRSLGNDASTMGCILLMFLLVIIASKAGCKLHVFFL